MEVYIYSLIFITGAFIGSFASLAVFRLPLKQDIIRTHSYCPNCKNKLTTIDLIPIFSYLFLRGRCRHCGQKIRARYIILEVCSGIVTVFFVRSMGFSVYNLDLHLYVNIIFYLTFITTLILIAGIEKEHKTLQKSVIVFGLVLEILYLIFSFTIYRLIMLILLIGIVLLLKRKSYLLECFAVVIYTLFFAPVEVVLICSILSVIYWFIKKKNFIFAYNIGLIILMVIYNFMQIKAIM